MVRPAPPLVVVPAHDEARVVGRCLRALLDGAQPGELRVVVVSNGSGDGTAEVALTSARPGELVEVIEIAEASKVLALRAGLARSDGAPVVVVDADVVVPTGTVRALVRAVAEPGVRVAGARPVVDTTRATWPVRRYYRVWQTMPYVRGGVIGTGVFALAAPAVDEIGPFPDVVNDDGWVRRRFAPEQRRLVDEPFTVLSARTAGALTARRARVINGNRALDEQHGADADAGTPASVRAGLVARQFGVLDAATFVLITLVARVRAAVRRRRGDTGWSTDATSRT